MQRSNNACLQTQLENEKRTLQEKENTVQATKEELNSVRSKSSTEIDDAKKRLESTEEKVQKLEDEVFTANEESSRLQAEIQRYKEEIMPALENKIKALEEENLRSSLKVKVRTLFLEVELKFLRLCKYAVCSLDSLFVFYQGHRRNHGEEFERSSLSVREKKQRNRTEK